MERLGDLTGIYQRDDHQQNEAGGLPGQKYGIGRGQRAVGNTEDEGFPGARSGNGKLHMNTLSASNRRRVSMAGPRAAPFPTPFSFPAAQQRQYFPAAQQRHQPTFQPR